jgi:hypothetical protein
MKHRILFAGLITATASLLTAESAFADHCSCNGGYSIGGCTTPAVRNYSGTTYFAPSVTTGYYHQPQIYYYQPQYFVPQTTYFRSYPSYGYSSHNYARSGISIRIGSGSRLSYGYRPYGFGRNYGHGFGFGSSFHLHSRRHHHHH